MIRFEYEQRDGLGRIGRRQWLRLGLGGLLAGSSAQLRAADSQAKRPAGFGRAKSVIFVFASGGQSQIDLWDPKPLAPDHVRGAFQTVSTKVPGVAVCEHLPRIAQVMDRVTLVRSMSHADLDHGSAAYLALTGRYHSRLSSNPPPRPTDFPTYGAVQQRVRRSGRFPYDAIHVNGPALVPFTLAPGQNGGFLGRRYEPLVVGDVTQQEVALHGLDPQSALPPVRMRSRQTLRQSLNLYKRELEQRPVSREIGVLYDQALRVLDSPRCREAFDLSREPDALRDRYGRHRSGQACLLARRLVEAGVPWITVVWNHSNRGQDRWPGETDQYGWDTHNDIFDALKIHLLPRFDESFATLLLDLETRGLLDETLVVCMGEFGRAPLVALEPNFKGATPGRKHWANVYSLVAAGAGVARGGVVGASDRLGGEPRTKRFGPWDMAATMFSAQGIDPHAHFTDPLGRPFPIATGNVIEELYG